MKHLAKFIVIATVACALISCSTIRKGVVSTFYVDKTLKRATRLTNSETGKTVILVPMVHIGTEEGYAQVRTYLDSLKADGFVTFCEGLASMPFHLDTIADITTPMLSAMVDSIKNLPQERYDSLKMSLDTLYRKVRYIMNTDISVYLKEYANKSNKDYTIQSADKLGLTTNQDIWVDYTYGDLVALYESKQGQVELTQYDFETALDQPYKQKNVTNQYAFTRHFRDDLLQRRIIESEHQKIAIVYGAAHTRRLKLDLRYLKGYEVDKKYKAHKQK